LEEEKCCGGALYEVGDYTSAKAQASILAEEIRRTKAKQILMLDPECYRMFLTRYPRWGINIPHRIFQATEFIWDLFEREIIRPHRTLKDRIVYHDPFQLARYVIDHESPRKILNKVCGGNLAEMNFTRARAHCCGAAGALYFTNPEIALEMARDILEEAKQTQAEILATASPFCQFLLEKACRDYRESGIKVKSILEIILQSMG
jgi:Fe-S oxidoreductase